VRDEVIAGQRPVSLVVVRAPAELPTPRQEDIRRRRTADDGHAGACSLSHSASHSALSIFASADHDRARFLDTSSAMTITSSPVTLVDDASVASSVSGIEVAAHPHG
jgi:hypothetical protein